MSAKLSTILNEYADPYRKSRRVMKITLSSGEEVIGRPHTLEPGDDCILVGEHDGADRWVVISHITSIQEWMFDD